MTNSFPSVACREVLLALARANNLQKTEIAHQSGLTESEVDDAVAWLVGAGFGIRQKGDGTCQLDEPVLPLEERRIKTELEARESPCASRFEVKPSVDSTNRYLLSWPDRGTLCGRVCLAEYQTRGRGRLGRVWEAQPFRNIMMSMAWISTEGVSRVIGLSVAVGVTVAEVLRRHGLHGVNLKWPNDILWQGAKIGGILTEAASHTDGSCTVVVGLGINVSNRLDVSRPNALSATSLESALGRRIDRTPIVIDLIDGLYREISVFEHAGLRDCWHEWNRLDAYRDKPVEATPGGRRVRGIGEGIDETGAFRIRTEDGGLCILQSGELSLRPLPSTSEDAI